jgi:protoporphyrinogen IX oxidase
MTIDLGAAYNWVKAAHVVFVIFWMAGLFMLPRYLVYHQEALGEPAQETLWIEREAKLRQMILTPSMIAVWVLGLLLAGNLGLFNGAAGLGWLHAKLAIVVLLSAYHGWAVGYGKRLAKGVARLTNRQLRMANELPALAAVLIVVLVIAKPF